MVCEVINQISDIIISIKEYFLKTYIYEFTYIRGIELIIFTVGLIQIHLAVKEKPIAWLLVVFNCTLLMYIYGSKGVIGQILLYGFLLVNAILAFIGWKKRDQNNNFVVKIKRGKFYINFIQLILLSILIFVIINIIQFLKANFGIISNNTVRDICILVFTIYAFTLQRYKYVESWFYLIIIDINVVLFYIDLELYMLALIRGYITFITTYGFFKWLRRYRKERLNKEPSLVKVNE